MEYIFIGISILIAAFWIVSFIIKYKNQRKEITLLMREPKNENELEIKKRKLDNIRRYIHLNTEGEYNPENRSIFVTDELKSSFILASGILGGSISGVGNSYYNIYNAFSGNEEFINIMGERYNHKFLDADIDEWLKILKELNESESLRKNYVSNFTGSKAELLGMEKLEELGYEVEQYESRIHPDDDLVAIAPSGEELSISVKSYASVDSLKNAVNNHPNSSHYLINEELTTKISSSRVLKHWFEEKNITLINGGYYHSELRKDGEYAINAFAGMEGSVSDELAAGAAEHLLDGLPVASLVCFGYKWRNNRNSLIKGEQSLHEFKVNLTGDGVGLVGRAAATAAFGKLGALAGVAFGPVGIAAGGVVGGLIGASGTGQLISKSKNTLKWGSIYKAQKEVSEFYDVQLFNCEVKSWLLNEILKVSETKIKLIKYTAELEKYKDELDENSPTLPTLQAVVIEQNKNDLENYLQLKEELLNKLIQSIENEFISWYTQINNGKNKQANNFITKRLLGEWVLRQTADNTFPIDLSLSHNFDAYINQANKSPNYSTKFPFDPVSNLTALSIASQLEIIELINLEK